MVTSRKQSQSNQDKIIAELESLPDAPFCGFTAFQDDVIRRFYPTKSPKEIAKILGKTAGQIHSRAAHLGVRRR